MNKLSRAQLTQIEQQIQQTNSHEALHTELVDHIASLIEQRMDQGQDFPVAFDQVMQQANPQALAQLTQRYIREFTSPFSPVTPRASRIRLRSKRRPDTKPFQYMLLSSVLTFLLLIGFLVVVSRPLSVPIGAFQTVWGAAGFMCILVVRWWLARRLRKPKHLQTA